MTAALSALSLAIISCERLLAQQHGADLVVARRDGPFRLVGRDLAILGFGPHHGAEQAEEQCARGCPREKASDALVCDGFHRNTFRLDAEG